MKIGIDCGHTLTGADYGAVGIKAESVLTREVGIKVISKLQELGHTAIKCYKDTCSSLGDSLSYRANTANNNNVDLYVSIHFNCFNGSAYGSEVFTYGGKELPQARAVLNNICAVGYANRGIKDGSNLYVLKNTKMKSMLIECCFCDNSGDMSRFNAENMANSIVKGLVGKTVSGGSSSSSSSKTSIVGKSVLNAEALAQHVLKNNSNPKLNCSIKELATYFIEEGNVENIRGDIAFCQAIKETGYFKYGGDVVPEQNNYSGLGTTGGGVKGAYFKTPREGVRAQIQHLKAYASKETLKNTCIDSRYNLVEKGIAPNWEDLNGKWAVPGVGYGEDILKIYNSITKIANDKREEKKVKAIVIYNEGADRRAAEYLADYLNCPTISNSRKFDYSCVENVYAVGNKKENYTSHLKTLISGSDRYSTMQAVLDFIKKNS